MMGRYLISIHIYTSNINVTNLICPSSELVLNQTRFAWHTLCCHWSQSKFHTKPSSTSRRLQVTLKWVVIGSTLNSIQKVWGQYTTSILLLPNDVIVINPTPSPTGNELHWNSLLTTANCVATSIKIYMYMYIL